MIEGLITKFSKKRETVTLASVEVNPLIIEFVNTIEANKNRFIVEGIRERVFGGYIHIKDYMLKDNLTGHTVYFDSTRYDGVGDATITGFPSENYEASIDISWVTCKDFQYIEDNLWNPCLHTLDRMDLANKRVSVEKGLVAMKEILSR